MPCSIPTSERIDANRGESSAQRLNMDFKKKAHSAYVMSATNMLAPVGSRKYLTLLLLSGSFASIIFPHEKLSAICVSGYPRVRCFTSFHVRAGEARGWTPQPKRTFITENLLYICSKWRNDKLLFCSVWFLFTSHEQIGWNAGVVHASYITQLINAIRRSTLTWSAVAIL